MLRIIHPPTLIRDKLRDRLHYSWKEAGRRASWSDLRHTGRKIGDIICPDQDLREALPSPHDNTSALRCSSPW